jgi:hypothetical protein
LSIVGKRRGGVFVAPFSCVLVGQLNGVTVIKGIKTDKSDTAAVYLFLSF